MTATRLQGGALLALLLVATWQGGARLWHGRDAQRLALPGNTARQEGGDGSGRSTALARLACSECGVVGAMPENDGQQSAPAGYYLLQVRMQDGSYRRFVERVPVSRREGARVIVIGGR